MHTLAPALPTIARLVEAAAKRLGCAFTILDPTFGYLFEVRRGDRAVVLIGGVSPANTAPAGRLCRDKHYTNLVLERAGYRTPGTVRCLAPQFFTRPDYASHAGVEPGLTFADANGFPVVVKPNQMSHGTGVSVVQSRDVLGPAIEALWEAGSPIVLVQECLAGRDLRLNFVGDEFIGGYERSQVAVVGDGTRSVRDLLTAADTRWADDAFAARFADEVVGPRLEAILPKDEHLKIGSDRILNLNQLATARIIETLPDAWLTYCLGIGKAVGACHFGIDIKSPGLDHAPETLVVIEVNGSPLLTGMYELGYEELAIRGQAKALQLAFDAP